MIATGEAYNNKWVRGVDQGVGDLSDSLLWKSSWGNGLPISRVDGIGLNGLLHHFAGSHKIGRPLWVTGSQLNGTSNHLFDVFACLDLSSIPAVLRNNLLLIRYILNPVTWKIGTLDRTRT
jgi:hypothetical protein